MPDGGSTSLLLALPRLDGIRCSRQVKCALAVIEPAVAAISSKGPHGVGQYPRCAPLTARATCPRKPGRPSRPDRLAGKRAAVPSRRSRFPSHSGGTHHYAGLDLFSPPGIIARFLFLLLPSGAGGSGWRRGRLRRRYDAPPRPPVVLLRALTGTGGLLDRQDGSTRRRRRQGARGSGRVAHTAINRRL